MPIGQSWDTSNGGMLSYSGTLVCSGDFPNNCSVWRSNKQFLNSLSCRVWELIHMHHDEAVGWFENHYQLTLQGLQKTTNQPILQSWIYEGNRSHKNTQMPPIPIWKQQVPQRLPTIRPPHMRTYQSGNRPLFGFLGRQSRCQIPSLYQTILGTGITW